MAELDEILKGFKPEFGNPVHIRIAQDVKTLMFLKGRDVHTKASREKMERLEKHIVWSIEQSQKPK